MSLTDDEIVVACRNIGFDLTCGACAGQFYTGSQLGVHTCPSGGRTETQRADGMTLDDVMDQLERLRRPGEVAGLAVQSLPSGRVTITIAFGHERESLFQGSSRTETAQQACAILQATASR